MTHLIFFFFHGASVPSTAADATIRYVVYESERPVRYETERGLDYETQQSTRIQE